MIYTRRTNCDSLQVFQSIISIFEIYNLWIREKANNFLFFNGKNQNKTYFLEIQFFFRRKLEKHGFLHCFFCKAISRNQFIVDRTTAIFLVRRKFIFSQFFWSRKNSISRNSSSRTKLVHLKCIDR